MSDDPEQSLRLLRQRIDDVDRDLVRLLGERMRTVFAIGGIKAGAERLSVFAPEREAELERAWRRHAEAHALAPEIALGVLHELLRWSRSIQRGVD